MFPRTTVNDTVQTCIHVIVRIAADNTQVVILTTVENMRLTTAATTARPKIHQFENTSSGQIPRSSQARNAQVIQG